MVEKLSLSYESRVLLFRVTANARRDATRESDFAERLFFITRDRFAMEISRVPDVLNGTIIRNLLPIRHYRVRFFIETRGCAKCEVFFRTQRN